MYVCSGVGGGRLSRCVWMRMVLDGDGEARCCRLDDNFFIFCLRRGGGYMYS